MLEENKNLKSYIRDNSSPLLPGDSRTVTALKNSDFIVGSYTKLNKLISALYMVTDIMDKEEPLRNKLRLLGSSIISDIHSFDKGQTIFNQINNRVSEILSFMEIAASVGIISKMNSGILIKEFSELKESILEANSNKEENWLEEFMKEEEKMETKVIGKRFISMGHHKVNPQSGMRIGVQSGSTLMKALSDRIPNFNKTNIDNKPLSNERHDVLKSKRHEEIILVIKDKMKSITNFDGATITDIRLGALSLKNGEQSALASCGEKTLQRELIYMVSGGILKKTGEKRWSKYSLK